MTPPVYQMQLISRRSIAQDMFELRFTKPHDFHFITGQFIQLQIPEGDSFVLRSYSLSSTPDDEYIELCVKILPDGKASKYLLEMTEGSPLTIQGPLGRFTCVDKAEGRYFVATGAGLAPIMGMIRDELPKNGTEIHLLFGVRSEDDMFWIDRLEELKKKYEFFSYHVTLSQPKPNGGWAGLRGRVTDHLLHHLIKHHYYLCGSAPMVKAVRAQLLQNGIPLERIHFEIF